MVYLHYRTLTRIPIQNGYIHPKMVTVVIRDLSLDRAPSLSLCNVKDNFVNMSCLESESKSVSESVSGNVKNPLP